jgi:hypothetical protein
MISTVDPAKLREPTNMSDAVIAKCHAENQCINIDEELSRLRSLRRKWNKRLGVTLRAISKFATKGKL